MRTTSPGALARRSTGSTFVAQNAYAALRKLSGRSLQGATSRSFAVVAISPHMRTPCALERAPAAWTAAQIAAVREATAKLRAARLQVQKPRPHPVPGYAALLAGILLLTPLLTCSGSLPVVNCAGVKAKQVGNSPTIASSKRQASTRQGETRDEEGTPQSWYTYRGVDGATVTAFGVPPLGSTVLSPDQVDPRLNSGGQGTGQGGYAGLTAPSSNVISAPGRGRGGGHYH